MQLRTASLALVCLCALPTVASAARLNKCVGGAPWYRATDDAADIRASGEFYRRPDGSMYFTYGSGVEKHEVDVGCFSKIKDKPPVYNAQ